MRPAKSGNLAVLCATSRAQKHKHRERQKRQMFFRAGAQSQCATTLAAHHPVVHDSRAPLLVAQALLAVRHELRQKEIAVVLEVAPVAAALSRALRDRAGSLRLKVSSALSARSR